MIQKKTQNARRKSYTISRLNSVFSLVSLSGIGFAGRNVDISAKYLRISSFELSSRSLSFSNSGNTLSKKYKTNFVECTFFFLFTGKIFELIPQA
jgi:hypothetical protein